MFSLERPIHYPETMRRKERISGFVEAIWQWYAVSKRPLPWRDSVLGNDTERAYRILVSEVMLQQTQVERVKVIYIRFLKEFPTLRSLAEASNREVILAWRGMGYNSRALRLRDAARRIQEEFNGIFPNDLQALESIKGLGHYTAAAIRNFAFNLPTPCIDTNIRRILHRTFVCPERPDGTWKKDDRYLLKIADEVLEAALAASPPRPPSPLRPTPTGEGGVSSVQRQTSPLPGQVEWHGRGGQGGEARFPHDARNWHAALMDFGSLVQTKKNPKWDQCPLTARTLMKASAKNFPKSQFRSPNPEHGRKIVGRFVPDRVVRGRIVEVLRDTPSGLSLDALGRRIAADWSMVRHREWLETILARLQRDAFVAQKHRRYRLAD